MGKKAIRFIFFGNYFVGLLAVALNIESTLQLKLPLNSAVYYCLLFLAPIIYYTHAYSKTTLSLAQTNLRSKWYYENKQKIVWSQGILLTVCLLLGIYFVVEYYWGILALPYYYWLALLLMYVMALLYYGLLPKSFIKLNLRNTGWLKAFIIGFVWACCANILPLVFLKIEKRVIATSDNNLWAWLFIKNWMFCSVNAIMFDIKDYPTDANRYLRTFVVRFGLRRTIFYILIPILVVGLISLFIFAYHRHFSPVQVYFNVLPFLLTIFVAYSLHKRKNILYYLMVIDGVILFKALCGILGSFFAK